jgi:putative membrane protein
MIVRPHPTFFEKTFAIHGSILVAILPKVLFACLTGLAAYLVHSDDDPFFAFTPFTALGVAISLFLGFRNNACYERWWEGRKQWGAQVICTRNLARTCLTFLGSEVSIDDVGVAGIEIDETNPKSPTSRSIASIISSLGVCHSHLLRGQLRGIWLSGHPKPPDPSYPADAVVDALKYAPEGHHESLASAKNQPDAALRLAASWVQRCLATQTIDTIAAQSILKDLNDLSSVQGACERLSTGKKIR